MQVHHVLISSSDHMGLLVDLKPNGCGNRQRRRRQFRFEHSWVREKGCEDQIREAWSSQVRGTAMYRVSQKIKQCRILLLNWNRSQVRVTPRLIEDKKKRLYQMECLPNGSYDSEAVNRLRREVNILQEKEEIMWRQRSRISWLQEGDRNTKYFHACASQRKRTNNIARLRDSDGQWQTDQGVIGTMAVDYFQNLFTTSSPHAISEVTSQVDPVVSEEMNEILLTSFTEDEIRQALFQMSPSKAPGPDGMTALFFQKYWNIVGPDVIDAVLDFLNTGKMLSSINFTNIVLIPKVKSPANMTQFRPISLCNVLYKIVSKVLVNRMKVILPRVISDSQSAFVSGRMITDNVIISFEVLHYLKNLRGGHNYQMAAKLDMSKAYDRVEWDYLKAMLLQLGFHQQWVGLIMECVMSPSFSVMVNGDPTGYIKPSRGLRQGDPLSPYLFLICAEGLSALMRKAEQDNVIRGISICRGGTRVSHLFFADDSIIFCRASSEDCEALQNLLLLYENAS